MSLIAVPKLLLRRRRVLAVIALTLLLPGVAACARSIATATAPAPSVATLSPDPEPPAAELVPGAIPPGARIRYHVHDDGLGLRTGKVGRATADTVWLANGRALPVSNLRRLELSLGGASVERRMAWGAGIGASVGVLTGVLIPAPDTTGPANAPPRAAVAYIFATSAAVAGTIVGALLPGEGWERVALTARDSRGASEGQCGAGDLPGQSGLTSGGENPGQLTNPRPSPERSRTAPHPATHRTSC